MPKKVLMDEFHVSFLVPGNLRPAEMDLIARTLNNPRFHAGLKRAVKAYVAAFASLDKARVRLSR